MLLKVSKIHLLSALLCLIFSASNVLANCGLQGCPIAFDLSEKNRLVIDNSIQYSKFNVEHRKGDYTQVLSQLHYYGLPRWVVGGVVSVVNLDDGHETNTGFGNPVVYGEYHAYSSNQRTLAIGTQVELPWGDDENGIAAGHTELVPYASLTEKVGSKAVTGQIGYRYSTESGGHEDAPGQHTPLLVNPHADKEFLYRLGLQSPLRTPNWLSKIYLDGQHSLDGESKGTGYLAGGVSLGYSLSEQTTLGVMAELPLVSPRRFDSRVGLNLVLKF